MSRIAHATTGCHHDCSDGLAAANELEERLLLNLTWQKIGTCSKTELEEHMLQNLNST